MAARAGTAVVGNSRGSGMASTFGYTLNGRGLFSQSRTWRLARRRATECLVISWYSQAARASRFVMRPAYRGSDAGSRSRAEFPILLAGCETVARGESCGLTVAADFSLRGQNTRA